MAKDNIKKNDAVQKSKTNENRNKKGLLFTLFAVLAAVLIIAVVFIGSFYFIIQKNINGLAEKYENNIRSIPVLRHALPEPEDPEDPEYLTDREVRQKYQEYRLKYKELTDKLNNEEKLISDLQKYKDEYDKMVAENDMIKKDLKDRQLKLDEQVKQYENDKKIIDEIVASNDKEGFKEFFEKIEKETARQIYTDIMQEQKIDEDTKKFAQIYENMDPSAAAKIFEQMNNSQMDLVVKILKSMKKETSAEILAAMDVKFASKVTDKLAKEYIK